MWEKNCAVERLPLLNWLAKSIAALTNITNCIIQYRQKNENHIKFMIVKLKSNCKIHLVAKQ